MPKVQSETTQPTLGMGSDSQLHFGSGSRSAKYLELSNHVAADCGWLQMKALSVFSQRLLVNAKKHHSVTPLYDRKWTVCFNS